MVATRGGVPGGGIYAPSLSVERAGMLHRFGVQFLPGRTDPRAGGELGSGAAVPGLQVSLRGRLPWLTDRADDEQRGSAAKSVGATGAGGRVRHRRRSVGGRRGGR